VAPAQIQGVAEIRPALPVLGATPEHESVMHVDHIKPRRKYPHLALVFDNLQVLCHDCNHGKGNEIFDFRDG
jgi:5-methylcytosine-specific restriction endonuclease McrA